MNSKLIKIIIACLSVVIVALVFLIGLLLGNSGLFSEPGTKDTIVITNAPADNNVKENDENSQKSVQQKQITHEEVHKEQQKSDNDVVNTTSNEENRLVAAISDTNIFKGSFIDDTGSYPIELTWKKGATVCTYRNINFSVQLTLHVSYNGDGYTFSGKAGDKDFLIYLYHQGGNSYTGETSIGSKVMSVRGQLIE